MSKLEIRQLTFRDRGPYSLTINGAECVGLHGASGAGKSLFLRAVADIDPHGGSLYLDKLACADIPAHKWRKAVALLPAESFWWHDTVAEHFHDFSTLPAAQLELLGFDYNAGSWEVSRLSTGEKQRLAILRTLENQPRALLLDEPTASLDAENIGKVEQLLLDYGQRHNAPLLWVSHDPEQLARVAGCSLFMHPDGRLASEGEHHGC